MTDTDATVTPDHIEEAAARLGHRVRRTPLLHLAAGDLGLHGPITLKLELLQHVGSFKPRGAFNRVLAAIDTVHTLEPSIPTGSGTPRWRSSASRPGSGWMRRRGAIWKSIST